jgi:hypothetical protein
MLKQEELRTEIICGRQFTPEEILEIRETVRLFPKLSQTELAFTICENLFWYAPNGKHKIESCRELLKKLEARQWITLPANRYPGHCNKEKQSQVELKAEPEICGTVLELGTIELEPVRGREKI